MPDIHFHIGGNGLYWHLMICKFQPPEEPKGLHLVEALKRAFGEGVQEVEERAVSWMIDALSKLPHATFRRRLQKIKEVEVLDVFLDVSDGTTKKCCQVLSPKADSAKMYQPEWLWVHRLVVLLRTKLLEDTHVGLVLNFMGLGDLEKLNYPELYLTRDPRKGKRIMGKLPYSTFSERCFRSLMDELAPWTNAGASSVPARWPYRGGLIEYG